MDVREDMSDKRRRRINLGAEDWACGAVYIVRGMSADNESDLAHKLYYSEETYERLVGIKRVMDPEMVFWNPQAVGV